MLRGDKKPTQPEWPRRIRARGGIFRIGISGALLLCWLISPTNLIKNLFPHPPVPEPLELLRMAERGTGGCENGIGDLDHGVLRFLWFDKFGGTDDGYYSISYRL